MWVPAETAFSWCQIDRYLEAVAAVQGDREGDILPGLRLHGLHDADVLECYWQLVHGGLHLRRQGLPGCHQV